MYRFIRVTLTLLASLGLVVALTFLAAAPLACQAAPPRPVMWLSAEGISASHFQNAGPAFAPTDVAASGFTGGIQFPFLLGRGRTALFVGASWGMRRFHPSGLPAGTPPEPSHLHEMSADVLVHRSLGPQSALVMSLSLGAATDFEASPALQDVLRIQGSVLASRAFSERWRLGAGMTYGTGAGISIPLPLLLVEWNDGGRWRAGGTLPADLGGWYRAAANLELGVKADLEGSDYTTNGLFPAAEPRLQYVAGRVGPTINWSPARGIGLTFSGGAAFQRVRLRDGNDEVNQSNYDLRPAWFGGVRLQMSF